MPSNKKTIALKIKAGKTKTQRVFVTEPAQTVSSPVVLSERFYSRLEFMPTEIVNGGRMPGEYQLMNPAVDSVQAFADTPGNADHVLAAMVCLGHVVGGALKELLGYNKALDTLDQNLEAVASHIRDRWSSVFAAARVSEADAVAAFLATATDALPTNALAPMFLKQRADDVRVCIDPAIEGEFWHKKGQEIRISSVRNIEALLKRWGLTVWLNDLDQRACLVGPEGSVTVLDKHGDKKLWMDVQRAGMCATENFVASTVLGLAGQDRRNPFADELERLQTTWDGVPRVEHLFHRYAGVADTPLHRAWSTAFMLTFVRRIRRPGSELFGFPILEAPKGGEGKSTFARTLAREPKYFTDSLAVGASPKEVTEETRGKMLVEFAELRGLRNSQEFDAVKGMITRSVDTARTAYGRQADDTPRYFSMIGSTNQDKYLKNDGGLRRFWTMRTERPADIAALTRDVDQIWAEAAYLETTATTTNTAPEIWPLEAEAREARIIRSGVMSEVLPRLADMPEGAVIRSSDLVRACEILGAPGDFMRNSIEWSDQLRREGWCKGGVKREPVRLVGGRKSGGVGTWVKGTNPEAAQIWYAIPRGEDREPSFECVSTTALSVVDNPGVTFVPRGAYTVTSMDAAKKRRTKKNT